MTARLRSLRVPAAFAGALVLVAAVALLAPGQAEAQCSMCRTALEQNPEMAAGINRGIVVLLLTPYLIVGAVAAFVIRQRARRAAASSA